jgi:hypothetical protein
MCLTVKIVLFGWRFKAAQILSLRINGVFLHLCRIQKSKMRGKFSVSMSSVYMYIRMCVVE